MSAEQDSRGSYRIYSGVHIGESKLAGVNMAVGLRIVGFLIL